MPTQRTYAVIAGASYLIIFFSAIFVNFFVLEAIVNDPLVAVAEDPLMIRLGIMAFLLTVVFDVVVAWALFAMFRTHVLTPLSTLFRMMHAGIMGTAVFTLPGVLRLDEADAILARVDDFNTIWLIGLLFFGIHLILLSRILRTPKPIALFLVLAGAAYIVDTSAHFLLADYDAYAGIFLALVAVPSVIGEMSFTLWLLVKGGKVSDAPSSPEGR